MRLATYNVENLFERPIAFNAPGHAGCDKAILEVAQLNELFGNKQYSAADKAQMLRLLGNLGLLTTKEEGDYARLRRNHGKLVKISGPKAEIVAAGRTSWTGWVEFTRTTVGDIPVQNTAMVIADCNADVQAVMEVEGRRELRDFADRSIKPIDDEGFEHAMEIDGKDDRGISVGLLARHGWNITDIHSHVDDVDANGPIFSRDCPEYTVMGKSGAEVVVLVNHFKSQRGGNKSDEVKRTRQATRVAEIYRGLRGEGREVAIVGDFNATPDSPSLKPLLDLKPDLREVSECGNFDDGTVEGTDGGEAPLLGTYGETGKKKFDYLLLSAGLFDKVEGAGVYRKGVWHAHQPRGKTWTMYKTMEPGPDSDGNGSQNAASDHALLYADIDI